MIQQIRGELPIDGVDLNDAGGEEGAGKGSRASSTFLLSALRHVQEQHAQTGECLAGKLSLQTIIDVDDKEYVEKAIEKGAS